MSDGTVEIMNRPVNDVLAEVVFKIYKQTGIRVHHAEFNWMETSTNGVTDRMLRNVSVTSIGGPL